jgi:hypothetical protein
VSLLEELGYTRASHFDGGIRAWRAAGLPVESVEAPPVPLRPAPRAPHDWGSSLVDFFERRSTADLVWFWLGSIAVCAVIYWLLGVTTMGGLREGDRQVAHGARGLLTALYFSFVTTTSVGFGDVVPLGAARGLAIIEAVAGLLVFGAVVSKLVSRRQEQIVGEIHRIAFEERLERVQTDLHLVLTEIQAIAQLCVAADRPPEQIRARVDSASGICLAELRTIHGLLYQPESAPEEAVLEGILASLSLVLREVRDLMRCLPSRSPYLTRNLAGLARLANEICSECVPRRYAPDLREWMDAIQAVARELA